METWLILAIYQASLISVRRPKIAQRILKDKANLLPGSDKKIKCLQSYHKIIEHISQEFETPELILHTPT